MIPFRNSLFPVMAAALVLLTFSAACGDDDDDSGPLGGPDDDPDVDDDLDDDSDDDMNDDLDDDANDDADDDTDSPDDDTDDDTDDPCSDGEIWDEDLQMCIPEQCGLDDYPSLTFTDEQVLYVNAAFSGVSDGSMESPFTTLNDALAAAGEDTYILIAAGEYESTETLQLEHDRLALVGRCDFLVKVSYTGEGSVLSIEFHDDNLVQGISFENGSRSKNRRDKAQFFNFAGANGAQIKHNSIINAGCVGVSANSCNNLTLEGNRVLQASEYGIFLNNSGGVITGNTVQGTQSVTHYNGIGIWIADSDFEVTGNNVGYNGNYGVHIHNSPCEVNENNINGNGSSGIYVTTHAGDSPVIIEDNHIEANTECGIELYGQGHTITGNYVAGTLTDNDGLGGRGLYTSGSDLEVTNNIFDSNKRTGVFFNSADDVLFQGNEVTNTLPDDQGNFGRGVDVLDSSNIDVSQNDIEANAECGIVYIRSTGQIVENEVYDTVADADNKFGEGITVQESTDVDVSYNIVDGNTTIGIYFHDSSGEIYENEIRNTQLRAPNDDGYRFGHGIHVQLSGAVNAHDNLIEDNLNAGIYFLATQAGSINDNIIRRTTTQGVTADTSFGDGIMVVTAEGYTTIENNELEDNERNGFLADDSDGIIQGNTITTNTNSIVTQNQSAMEIGENNISNNDNDLPQDFEGRVMPVNDGMIERNGLIP